MLLQPHEMLEVSTIDRYQGAENQIVITSLVGSKAEKMLVFLGTVDDKNHKCVAQSTAKCGLYFVSVFFCAKALLNFLDTKTNSFPKKDGWFWMMSGSTKKKTKPSCT